MTRTDDMTAQYLETALWSSTDIGDDCEPLDSTHDVDDCSPLMRAHAHIACVNFLEAIGDRADSYDPAGLGHDLWLTRNGHGAGFWDGDYPEPDATLFTAIAIGMGEVCLYVGDDGQIHDN